MRIHHSLTALGGALALLTAATVGHAQSGQAWFDPGYPAGQFVEGSADGGAVIVDGFDGYTPAPYAPGYAPMYGGGGMGVPGAMFQPPYGNNHVPTMYPQYSPDMAPWPAISPFDPANVGTKQYAMKDGLWFNNMLWRQRDIEASVEYVRFDFQQPGDTKIGSRTARTFSGNRQLYDPILFSYGQAPVQGIDLGIFGIGPGVHPFPFVFNNTIWVAISDRSIFPNRNADVLTGGLNSNGVRLNFATRDEDGTGWWASGFYAPEADSSFVRGRAKVRGIPITQEFLTASTPNMQFFLFAKNGSLPLRDSLTPDALGFTGSAVKYDILYKLDYNTQAAGAELNGLLGYIHRSDTARVATFLGARYFNLDEHFGFRGIDSGFGYVLDQTTFRPPSGNPNDVLFFDYPLLKSFLNSDVISHMAGPQIGLDYKIGQGGAFHLSGHSTFGLLANYEQLEVTGNNIGNPAGFAHPEMHNGVEFLDNSFQDQETHMHVSPLLEQSINATIALPHLMPFLRKSYLTENAALRLGYTWTFIGEVSRPVDSINWAGFPLFPSVRLDRKNFTINQLSIGIECPF